MKVAQLIEFLEGCDPEAEVLLGIQPSYPFEHSIARVITRSEFMDPESREEMEYAEREQNSDADRGYRDSFLVPGKLNDVFLIEGGQVRYGSKDMFGW